MRRVRSLVPCLALLALLALVAAVRPATAAWPHDPNNGNLQLTSLPSMQSSPGAVSDGAGGVIVAWVDSRSGNGDVYAQRVSAAGVPLWTTNGVALCTAAGTQAWLVLAPDGAGGAIVGWNDQRTGAYDVYAQRVSANGVPQWTANGVAVGAAAGDQIYPTIAAVPAGGAILAWVDTRNGNDDVYAQRVSAAGAPQWTANGVAVCTAVNDQSQPVATADGSSGAFVAWSDNRLAIQTDIYAQRLNSSGATLWGATGTPVCTAANDQYRPMLAPDGSGGLLAAWYDYRGADADVYAQRLDAAGLSVWTGNGVALCTAANSQFFPDLVSDGAGGAIALWQDQRSGTYDIYAQRVAAGGLVQWAANGVALCSATGDQGSAHITSDGAGGAIGIWNDNRGGAGSDLYSQRISGAGAIQWTSNGVPLCTAITIQDQSVIVTDGAGGAIAAWVDPRNGNFDIYAQRIERYGQLGNPEPVVESVNDVPNDQGGSVKVTWSASYLDVDPLYGVAEYRVFRSVPGPLAPTAALRRGTTDDTDVAASEGRLLVLPSATGVTSWEYVGTHAAEAFALYSRVVATTSDSTGGGNPLTWFMVEARASTSVSSDRWPSAPDSGYSVDNLAPATPAPFTGQYAGGTTALHWNPNTEPDLAGYRLYRGSSVGFVPGPGNLVGALADTGYADPAGAPYVYKLTAVDVHGNESPVATLVPSGTLGMDGAPAPALSFAAPGPNPASERTTFRWTLSRPGPVRLSVYDAAGRRVALLRDGELAAGGHAETFALRDEAGRALASGLYLARLEAEGRVLTRRFATIR